MNGWRLLSALLEDPAARNSTFFSFYVPLFCQFCTAGFLFPTSSCSDSDASSADSEVSTASSTVKRVDVEKEKNGAPPGQVSSLLHPTWFILVSVTMLIYPTELPVVISIWSMVRTWRARTQWQTWRPPLPESSGRQTSSEQPKIKLFYSEWYLFQIVYSIWKHGDLSKPLDGYIQHKRTKDQLIQTEKQVMQ